MWLYDNPWVVASALSKAGVCIGDPEEGAKDEGWIDVEFEILVRGL